MMEHETLFDLANPELWVLVGLAAFIGLLIWLKVLPGALFKALDAHAEKIKAELDEAHQLREEAQALLAEVKAQRDEAERQAAGMIAAAKVDAELIASEAKAKLEEQITRRAEMAERKIAQAEAQAAADVKSAAVDLAAQAAEQVLVARLASGASDGLVDAAINQIATKLQ
ncbi:F0F1 ATP synthase subunit B [soil metagenome]